tara:strand:- start:136 stop:243 length:108 start_codon:yes stop_codon:yes gene_type:complete
MVSLSRAQLNYSVLLLVLLGSLQQQHHDVQAFVAV